MYAGAPLEVSVGTARRCAGALEQVTAMCRTALIHFTRLLHATAFCPPEFVYIT